MRRFCRALAAATVSVAAVVLGGISTEAAGAAEPGLESQFVAGLNNVRAGVGLPALSVDGELTAVARAWADQMAAAGGISHNPNVGGQVSAPWTTIGENVGAGPEVGALMSAFVASPSHYDNIVEPVYDYVGVGVTWGGDGRMYTVHVFMDLDGGSSAPAPEPAGQAIAGPAAAAPAPAPAMDPAPPAPPVPPPPPAPPPAAFAPARVATVLSLVGALDAGVR
jgi:hypothetical protein